MVCSVWIVSGGRTTANRALAQDSKAHLDQTVAEIVERHREQREKELVETFKRTFLSYRDDDACDGRSYEQGWAAKKPAVKESTVIVKLKVADTSWGTRPAKDILAERYPGGQLQLRMAELGLSGALKSETIRKLFTHEPDVMSELPSICHAVVDVADSTQGEGPKRAGMRCVFLPVAHAELNPIELLWATLRSCRRGDVVTERKGSSGMGKLPKLKLLVALMMANVSPLLVWRFYRRVNRIEELYDSVGSGPEVMRALAASSASSSAKTTSFDWKAHWCPPGMRAAISDPLTAGAAEPIRRAVADFSLWQAHPNFLDALSVMTAISILGPTGDAKKWTGYDQQC